LLLIFAIIIMAVAQVFMPIGSTVLILSILAIISGITVGILEVGGNTLLVWLHGDKAGAYLNGLHFFYGFGALLGPILVAGVIKIGLEIPKTFWFTAVIIFLIAVYLLFIPSPSCRSNDSQPSTKQIGLRLKLLIEFGVLFIIMAGIEASLSGWLFTYVVSRKTASEITASILNAGFWGAFMASRLLVIPFTRKVHSRILLLVCNIACLVSLMLLIPVNTVFLWMGVLSLGLSMGPLFPTLISMAQKAGIISGQTMGWLLGAGGVGAMVLPWVVSQFFKPGGPYILLYVIGICLLISAVLLLNIPLSSQNEKPYVG
jgi:FHS family Na+ dependent glucose MFS transporter 1